MVRRRTTVNKLQTLTVTYSDIFTDIRRHPTNGHNFATYSGTLPDELLPELARQQADRSLPPSDGDDL